MTDLSDVLRWIIFGILAMLGLSVLSAIARAGVALLGFGLRVLVLVLVAAVIVKIIDRVLG
jgi:hypothetical protein